eukprot:SAG31_NODE_2629_length_5350_cov_2.286612_1_plen_148_part_00
MQQRVRPRATFLQLVTLLSLTMPPLTAAALAGIRTDGLDGSKQGTSGTCGWSLIGAPDTPLTALSEICSPMTARQEPSPLMATRRNRSSWSNTTGEGGHQRQLRLSLLLYGDGHNRAINPAGSCARRSPSRSLRPPRLISRRIRRIY